MKRKDIKDIRTKTLKELKSLVGTAREELLTLNLSKSQNKLKDLRSIFWKKKDIARMLTVIREKEFESKAAVVPAVETKIKTKRVSVKEKKV